MRQNGEWFEGWYFKHQNAEDTVALIAGRSGEGAFVQVLCDSSSWYASFPADQYRRDADSLSIGGSGFSIHGIRVDLRGAGVPVFGAIGYHHLTPLRSDIMGPFRHLPLQCRHEIRSLHHELSGGLEIDGRHVDFSGGTGYIEGDRGRGFPPRYTWVQSNDFAEPCCVMLAIADIPMPGFAFRGTLGVVWYRGIEHRLATYNGAKVIELTRHRIALRRGQRRLEVDLQSPDDGHTLLAPARGRMSRTIHEIPACAAHFRFYDQKGRLLLNEESRRTSFEYVE